MLIVKNVGFGMYLASIFVRVFLCRFGKLYEALKILLFQYFPAFIAPLWIRIYNFQIPCYNFKYFHINKYLIHSQVLQVNPTSPSQCTIYISKYIHEYKFYNVWNNLTVPKKYNNVSDSLLIYKQVYIKAHSSWMVVDCKSN